MPARVLFLLHGIGQRAPAGSTNRPADAAACWSKAPVELLIDLAKRYKPDIDIGLDPGPQGLKIVPLSYCDLIVSQLDQWGELSDDAPAMLREKLSTLGSEIDALGECTGDDATVFWNGPVDVFFYRFLMDQAIRTQVREQITKAITSDVEDVGFICHSMGTAVLHDTLAEIFNDPGTFGTISNMNVVLYAAIANVSTVLKSIADPHVSPVRPIGSLTSSGQGTARVDVFLNVHRELDPVPHIGLFRPKWNKSRSFYLDVDTGPPKWIDVHGLVKYLMNPRVHIPIMNTMCNASISGAQEAEEIEAYDALPGDPCPTALAALAGAVHDVKEAWDDRPQKGAAQCIAALVQAFKAFKTARSACLDEGGIP